MANEPIRASAPQPTRRPSSARRGDEGGPSRISNMTDIGLVLRRERARRGISQAEMATVLGLTRQKLQLLEAGQPGVAVGTVLRALTEIGVVLLAIPSSSTEAGSELRRLADRVLASGPAAP